MLEGKGNHHIQTCLAHSQQKDIFNQQHMWMLSYDWDLLESMDKPDNVRIHIENDDGFRDHNYPKFVVLETNLDDHHWDVIQP